MTDPQPDDTPGVDLPDEVRPAPEPTPEDPSAPTPPASSLPAPSPEGTSTPAPAHEKVVERPHPLTGIANAWIALIAVVAFGGREFLEGGFRFEWGGATWIIVGVVFAVALISVIGGIITWRTTTFVVDDEEFRIERNLISKESTRIDFTKVQAVDIHRPLAARLLGLAAVQIDVGGSGGKSLKYLSLERAEQLRDHLLARMGGGRARLRPYPPATTPPSPISGSSFSEKSATGRFSGTDTEKSANGRFSWIVAEAAGQTIVILPWGLGTFSRRGILAVWRRRGGW